MTQIEKLEQLVKEWEKKTEELQLKSSFAREHKFNTEAQILWDQASLLSSFCMQIRLKVIEELIKM